VLVDTELQPVIFDTDNCHPPVRQPRNPGDTPVPGCTEPTPGYCRATTNGKLPFWDPLTCTCVSVLP
jgi:hypothetical protein